MKARIVNWFMVWLQLIEDVIFLVSFTLTRPYFSYHFWCKAMNRNFVKFNKRK